MIGSVRKRGKTWSYRIDFGKTYDGKRNQIEKGGYKTKKEADKALNDALLFLMHFIKEIKRIRSRLLIMHLNY